MGHQHLSLPIVIDTARRPAFIQLDPGFFVFHRLEECLSLALAHLPFLFCFALGDLARLCLFLRLFASRSFNFAS